MCECDSASMILVENEAAFKSSGARKTLGSTVAVGEMWDARGTAPGLVPMEFKSEADLKIKSGKENLPGLVYGQTPTPHQAHCCSGNPHTLDSLESLPPALVLRALVLLCRFSIQFEASWTDVHFIIVEIRLFGAPVATTPHRISPLRP